MPPLTYQIWCWLELVAPLWASWWSAPKLVTFRNSVRVTAAFFSKCRSDAYQGAHLKRVPNSVLYRTIPKHDKYVGIRKYGAYLIILPLSKFPFLNSGTRGNIFCYFCYCLNERKSLGSSCQSDEFSEGCSVRVDLSKWWYLLRENSKKHQGSYCKS